MGTRGPKGKSVVQKRLEGNPGKQKLPKGYVEARGDAERPAHISGYAADIWDAVVAAMPPGVYRATDSGLLAAYCIAVARQRDALARVAIEGEVVEVVGQFGSRMVRNPWALLLTEQGKLIATLGTRLGLDPMARENIKAPDQKPPDSKFAGLIGIDGGKK